MWRSYIVKMNINMAAFLTDSGPPIKITPVVTGIHCENKIELIGEKYWDVSKNELEFGW